MSQERQKTDALSDAVEIPEGATHSNKHGRYFKSDSVGYLYVWFESKWHPMYMTIKQTNNLIPL